MPVYRFHEHPLQPEKAHRGKGIIHAVRVHQRSPGSQLNFIDLVEVPPGTSIGRHRHAASDEEIYIILSGNAHMSIDGKDQSVGPGDVILNPAGGTHALENLGHETVRLAVIDVSTNGSPIEEPVDLN